MKFANPGEDNPGAPESLRRCGSFGLTKPPTTPVGVMRPVTPHSRQGCRQNLAVVHDGLSPSAKPIIFPNCN